MPRESYYLPKRQLVSQTDQAVLQRANVPRSRFLGSYSRKTAFDAGYLIPIFAKECLPGDHWNIEMTAYVRMATPIFPNFDNQRVDTHWFFCPNRLVWENWTKFMGEQATPTSSTDYTVPTMEAPPGGYDIGSVFDHMNLPMVAAGYEHITLPLRMYNLIYNEWYRDQNSINSATVPLGDTGADGESDYPLRRRAKSHDMFTSALPWPQKFTAPTVPVGGFAPVIGIGAYAPGGTGVTGPGNFIETGGLTPTYAQYAQTNVAGAIAVRVNSVDGVTPEIFADLSEATGVAINTFRQALQIQVLLERDARGGTRYTELLMNHFGVNNGDERLQRPEYIGGGQTPLMITPIAQTAPGDEPLGTLGGAGTAAGAHRATYAVREHGWIIGIMSIKTELSYQQGLHRSWSRQTRYDYPWPELSGLGEQAILRKEIYCTGNPVNDDAVFGYTERYDEMRQHMSEVTGLMRSTVPGSIDQWHMAQEFGSAPALGATFINDDPPMARILAAGELAANQQYLADLYFRLNVVRPLPLHGTPVGLGRF